MDPEELRQKCIEAANRGHALLQIGQAHKADQAMLQQETDEEAAQRIIETIPSMIETEAAGGRPSCEIVRVTKLDFKGETLDPRDLTGAKAIVYKHCLNAGLEPYIGENYSETDWYLKVKVPK